MALASEDLAKLQAPVGRDGQGRALWGTTYADLFFADTDFHCSMARRIGRQPFADREAPVRSIEDLLICIVLFDRPKDWSISPAVIQHESGDRLDVGNLVSWLRQFLDGDDSRFERLGKLLG